MNVTSNALIIVGLIGLITGGVFLIINAFRKRFRQTWKRWTVVTVCGVALMLVGVFVGSLPAEFKITSLAVEPQEVTPGESVTITAIVENPGEAESIYDAVLVVDGVQTKSKSFVLAPGERESISFTIVENTVGTHHIELGQLVDTFQVVESAEFEITFFKIEPLEVVPGESIIITASVMNVGAIEGVYHAALIIDGVETESRSVALAPGESDSVSFTVVENIPGTHYIELGQIGETFTVLEPAEFVVSNIDITPNPVKIGEGTTISISVENVGAGKGSFTTSLVVDGVTEQMQDIEIAADSAGSISFAITKELAGSYTVEVADHQAVLRVVEPVRPDTGTSIVKELSGGKARLTVDNGLDLDTVVILSRTEEPEVPLMAVYIRSEDRYTIRGITRGTYILYFSLGKDWDDYSNKFINEATYKRFDDDIKFVSSRSRYSVIEVTLHPVVGGTAATEYLDEDEFPGLK